MFKDTDEALARLAEELLKTEDDVDEAGDEEGCEDQEDFQDYDEEYEEAFEEEAPPEYVYDDTRAARGPAVYQNYSNDYGRNLRNYASGYRAYNADECDEDLDAFSQEVYDEPPEKSNLGLVITACVLATILGAVALLLVLQYKGVL